MRANGIPVRNSQRAAVAYAIVSSLLSAAAVQAQDRDAVSGELAPSAQYEQRQPEASANEPAGGSGPSSDGRRSAIRLEEIIVTGAKKPAGIQDTQASVSVLTGSRMEDDNILTLENAVLRVGNADIDTFGNVSLRGVDKNGSGGATTNRMVLGVYVDEVAQSFQSQRFASSTWDVSQIEVLRGPVTTVQGRNALIGAIVINTANPEFEAGGKLRASYGEDGAYQLAAAVTGPVMGDQLAFRLSAEQQGGDGSTKNITLNDDEFTKYQTRKLRGKLLFEPSHDLQMLWTGSYSESDPQPGSSSVTSEDPADRETIITSPDFSYGEMYDTSLKVSYDIEERVTLTSVTAYSESEATNVSPFNGLDLAHPERISMGTFDDKLFSQELRALYSGDRLTSLVGLYYADISNKQGRSAVIDAGLLAGSLSGFNTTLSTPVGEDISNYAIFMDSTFDLTDALELNIGARLDYEKNDYTRSFEETAVELEDGTTVTLLPAVPASSSSIDDREFLPKAGIVYRFTDDLLLGFTWSRGYRPGGSGVNATAALRGVDPINYEYGAEKTDNYEISFRSTWFDRALVLNANTYYVDWMDQQVALRGPLSGLDDFVIENVSSSTLYGAEIEMQANIDKLAIFVSLGFADSEFNEADIPEDLVAAGFSTNSLAGNEFAGMSDVTASAGLSYEWDSGFFLSGDVSYTSDTFFDSANTVTLPSYTLVNFNASYETQYGDIFLYARNVFDEAAQTGFFTIGSTPFYTLREGRNVGVGIQLDF